MLRRFWQIGPMSLKISSERLISWLQSIPVLAIFPAGKPTEPIVIRDLISSRATVIDALKQAGPSRATAGTSTASAVMPNKSVN